MVPFKGDFSSVPAPEHGIIECGYPDAGFPMPSPIIHPTSGNATHLGLIVPENSRVKIVGCSLDLEGGYLIGDLDMIFMNKKGHGIHVLGQSRMGLFGQPSSGHYNVIGGYGKFEGATGEMDSRGLVNPDNFHVVFQMEGMVSQPNH